MISADLEPPVVAEDNRIRIDCVFFSQRLEDAFRRRHLADDIGLAGACLLVPVLGGFVFAGVDYRVFGPGPQFYTLLSVRLFSFLVALFAWRGLRRCATPAQFDRLVFLLCLYAAAVSLYVNLTRPPGYIGHAVLNVMLVGLMYAIVPIPLALQALVGFSFSIAYVAFLPDHGLTEGALTTTTVIAASYATANILGVVTSARLNHRKRLAFSAALRETELRIRLEQALAEVRTLRGYLSICAWCKRVRDEKEGWQNVESFVQDRTHAQFTHSICPVCFETHFAAIAKAAENNKAS